MAWPGTFVKNTTQAYPIFSISASGFNYKDLLCHRQFCNCGCRLRDRVSKYFSDRPLPSGFVYPRDDDPIIGSVQDCGRGLPAFSHCGFRLLIIKTCLATVSFVTADDV